MGPYDELLLIPGMAAFPDLPGQRGAARGGRSALSISKIWVSSEASMYCGRANWGIPKQLAEFQWTYDSSGDSSIESGSSSRGPVGGGISSSSTGSGGSLKSGGSRGADQNSSSMSEGSFAGGNSSGAASQPVRVEVREPGALSPFFSAALSPRLAPLAAPASTRLLPAALLTLVQPALDPLSAAPISGRYWQLALECSARVSLVHLDSVAAGTPGGALTEAELARLSPLGVRLEGQLQFPAGIPLTAPRCTW